MIYLETERLILRDYTKNDKELYFKLKSDEKTIYYLRDIKLHSLREAEEDFTGVLADLISDNRKYYFFHIGIHNQIENSNLQSKFILKINL